MCEGVCVFRTFFSEGKKEKKDERGRKWTISGVKNFWLVSLFLFFFFLNRCRVHLSRAAKAVVPVSLLRVFTYQSACCFYCFTYCLCSAVGTVSGHASHAVREWCSENVREAGESRLELMEEERTGVRPLRLPLFLALSFFYALADTKRTYAPR